MNTLSLQSGSTYYYSNFKLFDSSIINDLLYCRAIRTQLQLPPSWKSLAQRTFHKKDSPRCPRSPISAQFVQDMFVYSWVYCRDDFSRFSGTLSNKFKNFSYDEDELEALKSIFFVYVNDLEEKLVEKSKLRLSKEGVLQPLVVVNYQPCAVEGLAEGMARMNLDRSRSDVECRAGRLRLVKLEKQQRKLESLKRALGNVEMREEKERWSVVKQFVVMVCDAETKEQMRVYQPSRKFYASCMQLWMLEKSAAQKMSFSLFSLKAKYFFGSEWKESYLVPLHLVFQLTEAMLRREMEKSARLPRDTLLREVLDGVADEMEKSWKEQILDTIRGLQ